MKRWKLLISLLIVSVLTLLNIHTVQRVDPKDDITGLEPVGETSPSSTFLAPNASFGACLMMKEDNDLLYEWISYHYLTLPLRYLVVGSDQGNTQNPHDVLKRWTNDIHYWVLNSTDFIGRHGPYQRTKKDDKDFFHHQLIYRQRAFVTTCVEFLKERGIHWIVMIDSDEFIVMNRFNMDDDDDFHATNSENVTYKMRKFLTNGDYSTVLDVIHATKRELQPIEPCYIMPRLRFGALERVSCSDSIQVNQVAKSEYKYAAMSTLRYKQHAGKNHFSANKFGKVMVDLSQIPDVSKQPKNVHRPFTDQCPYPVVWFKDVLFSVNHYTASWERYSHRQDERRNCENWIELAYHDQGNSCHQQIHKWFPQFIDKVGHKRAKHLLGLDATRQIQSTEECPPKDFDFTKLQKKYGWNISNLIL